jgi:hypothetical protein
MFFHCGSASGQSFSNVIYHLKGKNGNMSLKLQGASSIDSKTGVHYFRSPEKLTEMNELTEQDIMLLLDTFKKSAAYDLVFVDCDSGFSQVNTAVMKLADIILLIYTPGQDSSVKYSEFTKGIKYIVDRPETGQNGRILQVLNRATAGRYGVSGNSGEFGPGAVIDECQGGIPGSGLPVLTKNVDFLSAISSLCGFMMPGRADTVYSGGGESIAI